MDSNETKKTQRAKDDAQAVDPGTADVVNEPALPAENGAQAADPGARRDLPAGPSATEDPAQIPAPGTGANEGAGQARKGSGAGRPGTGAGLPRPWRFGLMAGAGLVLVLGCLYLFYGYNALLDQLERQDGPAHDEMSSLPHPGDRNMPQEPHYALAPVPSASHADNIPALQLQQWQEQERILRLLLDVGGLISAARYQMETHSDAPAALRPIKQAAERLEYVGAPPGMETDMEGLREHIEQNIANLYWLLDHPPPDGHTVAQTLSRLASALIPDAEASVVARARGLQETDGAWARLRKRLETGLQGAASVERATDTTFQTRAVAGATAVAELRLALLSASLAALQHDTPRFQEAVRQGQTLLQEHTWPESMGREIGESLAWAADIDLHITLLDWQATRDAVRQTIENQIGITTDDDQKRHALPLLLDVAWLVSTARYHTEIHNDAEAALQSMQQAATLLEHAGITSRDVEGLHKRIEANVGILRWELETAPDGYRVARILAREAGKLAAAHEPPHTSHEAENSQDTQMSDTTTWAFLRGRFEAGLRGAVTIERNSADAIDRGAPPALELRLALTSAGLAALEHDTTGFRQAVDLARALLREHPWPDSLGLEGGSEALDEWLTRYRGNQGLDGYLANVQAVHDYSFRPFDEPYLTMERYHSLKGVQDAVLQVIANQINTGAL